MLKLACRIFLNTITTACLAAAMQVLGDDSLRYLNEWHGKGTSAPELDSTCEGILINGVE